MKRIVTCSVQSEVCTKRVLKNCNNRVCSNCSCDCNTHSMKNWKEFQLAAANRAVQNHEVASVMVRRECFMRPVIEVYKHKVLCNDCPYLYRLNQQFMKQHMIMMIMTSELSSTKMTY